MKKLEAMQQKNFMKNFRVCHNFMKNLIKFEEFFPLGSLKKI